MKRALVALAVLAAAAAALIRIVPLGAQLDASPVILVETTRGAFAMQTFPREAPRTVAHIVELIEKGFYDGQRIHRALPGFLVQFGDPQTRDPGKRELWGRGDAASSGRPIGVVEISPRLLHQPGAVGVAHMGDPAKADSQIYIMLGRRTELDGQYAIFARVISGEDVPAQLQVGDEVRRISMRR